MNANDRLLRLALRCNAGFSGLCALLCLAASGPIAASMGLPEAIWLQALGVQLLVFAGFLVWLAARPRIAPAIAWGVVAADVAWVVGTLPLVAADLLTITGIWIALGVADVVAFFAILQVVGLRRMQRSVIV
jgi:hypothetical protein